MNRDYSDQNRINQSIFRSGGSLDWNSKIVDTFSLFSNSEVKSYYWPIIITAAEKGFGKSTAFEYLSSFMPDEICLEGDIMSLFAVAMHLKDQNGDQSILNMTYRDFANSDYSPWTVKIPNKDEAYAEIFSNYLGKNWHSKIRLCTGFRGLDFSQSFVIVVVPNYYFYEEVFEARRDAMINGDNSQAFKDHVRDTHVTLDFSDFESLNRKKLDRVYSSAKAMYIAENNGLGNSFPDKLDHALYVARSYDKK